MRSIKKIAFILLVLCVSNAFANLPTGGGQKQKTKPKTEASWVETTIASMTADESV